MILQPILDLITEREAATSEAADLLREQIGKLTDELRLAETELADLTTTRTTLTRLTSQNEAATSDDATVVSTVYQQIIACSTPPPARYAPKTSAGLSTSTPSPGTPKASEPS